MSVVDSIWTPEGRNSMKTQQRRSPEKAGGGASRPSLATSYLPENTTLPKVIEAIFSQNGA
jgi:hypothetical protein